MGTFMRNRIESQFDSFCKRVLKHKVRDYKREEARRLSREVALEEWLLGEKRGELAWLDEYVLEPIRLKGEPDLEIEITDVDLHERLISLSEEEQQLLLLSYFLDLTDGEIASVLKRPRRTIAYQRHRILEKLKSGQKRSVYCYED